MCVWEVECLQRGITPALASLLGPSSHGVGGQKVVVHSSFGVLTVDLAVCSYPIRRYYQ